MYDPYAAALSEILEELHSARHQFGPMHGPHEGYAVLLEEMDELWDEVKANKRVPPAYRAAMRAEALQVAAMALAFMVEVCDDEEA